jgi:starch synthase
MTGLIPFYLKSAYKKEPVFGNSRIIFTIGQNTFKEKLAADFVKKAIIHNTIKEKDMEAFKDSNNTAMFRGGASFADAITFGDGDIEKKLLDEFSKVRGKKVIPYNRESDLTDYLQLYTDLANK